MKKLKEFFSLFPPLFGHLPVFSLLFLCLIPNPIFSILLFCMARVSVTLSYLHQSCLTGEDCSISFPLHPGR